MRRDVIVLEPGLTLLTALLANALLLVGSALQASVGMGLALVAVPLLILLDPRFVPGPMLLAGAMVGLSSARREWHAFDAVRFRASLLGLGLGTLGGAATLSAIRSEHLGKVFGLMVLVAVLLSVVGLRVRATRTALFTGGGASGFMGTMVGIHGPPIALVLQHARPDEVRAMLGAFFFVAYLGSVAALALFGLFGWVELTLSAVLLPGVFAGVLIAPRCTRFVNPTRMRIAILTISAAGAVMLLVR